MQPTEHKPPFDKELIAHIKKSLVAHEETYVEGAWEKFNSEEKGKKKPILWLGFLRGAAAVLLLAFIAFLFTNKEPVQAPLKLAKEQSTTIKGLPATEVANNLQTTSTEQINEKRSLSSHAFANKTGEQRIQSQEQAQVNVESKNEEITPILAVNNHVQNTSQNTSTAGLSEEQATLAFSPQNKETKKVDIMEFLTNETKKNASQQEPSIDRDNKFTIGLVVAPSFGNTKRLNMGYGLSMDYSLSDKISLNSGIAYSEMTASKKMALPASSAIINSYGNAKNLESVEEQLVGIDVPLEVKYHVNKNFYANVGISALAVINQKRNQTFVQDGLVQMAPAPGSYAPNSPGNGAAGPAGPAGGGAGLADRGTALLINSERSSLSSSINDYSYLGFYNFSFGYQKKISKRHFIAIEPFLKVPMKEIKNENLKLIGSGVKLKFDF